MDGLQMVDVPGTAGHPYGFGAGDKRVAIEIRGFQIGVTPVTQELWTRVMGNNPASPQSLCRPVTHVSWNDITQAGGFLDRLNSGRAAARYRLPSEAEWEYAARGGPRWQDDYAFSGSNDPDAVAWYGRRWTRGHQVVAGILGPHRGWRTIGRVMKARTTRSHDVASKAPNQLGLYDMSGNVWEWCRDVCVDDLDAVPRDGSPYEGAGDERRLRGGCHHNWDLHCRVWWRYGIAPEFADGCIGFRLVRADH